MAGRYDYRFRGRRGRSSRRRRGRRRRGKGNSTLRYGDLTCKTTPGSLLDVHSYPRPTNPSGTDGGRDVEVRLLVEFLDVDDHVADLQVNESIGGTGLALELGKLGAGCLEFGLSKLFNVKGGVGLERGDSTV